jgi:hypothetical protein
VPSRLLRAGPLDIEVTGDGGFAMNVVESTLSLFDVPWTLTPTRPVSMDVRDAETSSPASAIGSFLVANQMTVDTTADGMRATTTNGATIVGVFEDAGERWLLRVPAQLVAEDRRPEIEDLVSLVVTTGWRRARWIALHAAGLTRNDVTALVCAGSRGGKTTFSMAMVSRGWRLIGDDKLLLGAPDGTWIVAGIKHMMNVDPAAAAWFPELGDLTLLPEYSAWSPKRRVSLSSVWPEAAALQGQPTHVVQLIRTKATAHVRVSPLSAAERISVLLHQTVIPLDRTIARHITATLAVRAERLQGIRVEIPDDIYGDLQALDVV